MPVNRKDSDWLNSLQGKSPLLSRSEWKFIAEVRRRIIQNAESQQKPNFTSNRLLRYNLSVMKDNFEKVVESLKENLDSKEYFLRTYPEWRTVRDLTIKQLKEIAKSVNQDSQNCTATRGVTSAVSLVGGLICLATGGVALRLLGFAFMGLGSLGTAGTSLVENDLLEQNIKKAERIIEEDKKYSEKLWDWIKNVSSAQEALNVIRSIHIENNLKKIANDFHAYYKNAKQDDLTMIIPKSLSFLKISPEISHEIADVIGILITTSMLFDRYRPYFNLAFEAYKHNKILISALEVILSSVNMPSLMGNKKLTTFQKSTIITRMALDAINIIRASEDVNETSKEAKKVIEAAEKLEEEARSFQKLYDTVIVL